MDKNSLEYKIWWRSTMIFAMVALVIIPICALFLGFLEDRTHALNLAVAAVIVGLIIVPLATVHRYIRARQMYKLRLSGWTPLEIKKREDLVVALFRKIVEALKKYYQ